jgi:hypothetical protein
MGAGWLAYVWSLPLGGPWKKGGVEGPADKLVASPVYIYGEPLRVYNFRDGAARFVGLSGANTVVGCVIRCTNRKSSTPGLHFSTQPSPPPPPPIPTRVFARIHFLRALSSAAQKNIYNVNSLPPLFLYFSTAPECVSCSPAHKRDTFHLPNPLPNLV